MAGLLLISRFNLPGQIRLKYEDNITLTYDEVIAAYKQLDEEFETARLFEMGQTDIGKPLHLFMISKDKDFSPESLRKKNKRIILINNGIHPGEPCGIDASIKFSDDILRNRKNIGKYLENNVITIIPVYSVGGTLNRSAYHRANQDSPPECGFRGNAQNLDLNRDFIKADSKNARSFIKIFHFLKPDVFLDTHTTNGSDHQYTITLIATYYQKLPEPMGNFLNEIMVPALFEKMKKGQYEMTPYVNWIYSSPENGIAAYLDNPRFSTGFASLFNTFAFMTENHVYKDFKDRVLSVYDFIVALVEFTSQNAEIIGKLKVKADDITCTQDQFTLTWNCDTTRFDTITFKGYDSKYQISPLTGLQSFYYDRESPFEKEIPYYNYYIPDKTIKKPAIYIIPQAWQKVIDHLQMNGIEIKQLTEDKEIKVEAYYIKEVEHSSRPYNGHFRNTNITTRSEQQQIQFYKGDWVIIMDQPGNRFIVEVLEPMAADSYLSWNFFDPIFDRREYFSPAGFEKKAIEWLKKTPELKAELEKKKKEDSEFAKNHYAQLSFIYTNSPYYEKSYRRYPVYRINEWIDLPLN
jgi:hypothetical protein